MSKKLKQMLAAYGLVLPSFLTVMLVVAWPILTAIKTSFTDPDTGGFTFDNYKYFFETPRELTNILFTLGIVFLTVALAIVLAYLLALYLRFVKSKVSRLIGNLYLLPRFVPSMVAVRGACVASHSSSTASARAMAGHTGHRVSSRSRVTARMCRESSIAAEHTAATRPARG